MHEYHIDIFVIGDDWQGKFDYLKDEGVDPGQVTALDYENETNRTEK